MWRSLAAQPKKVPSPEWHRTVLEERLLEMDSGTAKFLTLDELKDRLAKRE
ncbi:MAG: addiction module protein [Verrucomicrobiota bacterium]